MKFSFKQFDVYQEKSAMKVGTDGVLLAAWTPINPQTENILDIGAGTGLISLIIAQRSEVEQIDAIEIDDDAYEECVFNFEQSPWNDRLFCYHAALEELVEEPECLYDLIVSNPPFFTEDYISSDTKRNSARHTSSLSFEELISSVDFLLSDSGVFSVIIPFREKDKFIELAKDSELYPTRITNVRGTATTEIKRTLITFERKANSFCHESELIIEIDRHQYTQEYIDLTKDFYLKM